MPNVKFSYLYRDSENYKNYGYVIVAKPINKTLLELEEIIRSKLIDEQWFYADEWEVPALFFNHFDRYNDPTWHEFESVELSDEKVNCSIPIM